jgi:hypothetical protein
VVALAVIGLLVVLGIVAVNPKAAPERISEGPTDIPPLVPPAPAAAEEPASASFQQHSRVPGYKASFYVLGFVTNTSPFAIDKPKITVILLDKSGNEVTTRVGFAEDDWLAPQAKSPVEVLIADPPAHDQLSFEVVARKADFTPEMASGLRLQVLEPPHVTFGKSWALSGKVFNEGSKPARFVKVEVLAFDNDNRLIGLDTTYADGESLAPGASARFRAMPLYAEAPLRFEYSVSGRVP